MVIFSSGPPPPPPPGGLKPGGPNLSGSNPNLSNKSSHNSSTVTELSDGRKLTKLHWREAQVNFNANKDESIWCTLNPIDIDKEKLACLFELKQTEVKTKVRFLCF